MIAEATSGDAAVTTTHYECLRGQVLEGRTATGGFGLVVLIREGVAAWLTHAAAPLVTLAHRTAPNAAAPAASTVPDEIHADVIGVLATMAMAILPEVHT